MKDRILVLGYVIFYMTLVLLNCSPRILAEFSNVDLSYVSENFSVPLDIFAWGLFGICAGYCGLDRASLIKKSSIMQIGDFDVGNKPKLLKVIFLLIIVLFETMTLNFVLGHDLTVITSYGKQTYKGINLPQDGIATAIVGTIFAYIGGNKVIRYASNVDTIKTEVKNEKNNSNASSVR